MAPSSRADYVRWLADRCQVLLLSPQQPSPLALAGIVLTYLNTLPDDCDRQTLAACSVIIGSTLVMRRTMSPPFGTPPRAVRRALEILDEEFANAGVTLKWLAGKVGVSQFHLDRQLSCHTGQPFTAHLRQRRMAVAIQLLTSHPLSVKEVAAAVGFRHASSFSRVFRRTYGAHPSAFKGEATS